MRLAIQYSGQKFIICAIVCNDESCAVVDFLEQVKRDNIASHRSLVNIIKRHADSGVIRNVRKSRVIRGRRNLLEFKSKQGDRLLYFYGPHGITVLVHGFHKGAPEQAEYDKAEAMRDQYLREVGNG